MFNVKPFFNQPKLFASKMNPTSEVWWCLTLNLGHIILYLLVTASFAKQLVAASQQWKTTLLSCVFVLRLVLLCLLQDHLKP